MEKHKLAACGVDCNECASFKVTIEHDLKAAELIVEWFREQGWIEKEEGAEAVMSKAPICSGCWDKTDVFWKGSGSCGNCGFRSCCEEKNLNHCGECNKYPCGKYDGFTEGNEGHKKAMQYLLSLKSMDNE